MWHQAPTHQTRRKRFKGIIRVYLSGVEARDRATDSPGNVDLSSTQAKRCGYGTEALRGLAVAATEMGNGERSPSAETPLVDTSNEIVCQPSWSPASPTGQIPTPALPDASPYTVQAIRSTGLSYIKHPDGRWDEETWLKVKRDVGHAVWAAGTVTLVVDLL